MIPNLNFNDKFVKYYSLTIFYFWSLNNQLLELILHLRWKWGFPIFDQKNARHAFRAQLILHFGCRQSLVSVNVELLQSGFQSAAADCVYDQRKLWRIRLPVRRPRFVVRISSDLETEILGVVAEVGPEVEARRTVDATKVEHNSLSVVRRSDDSLQVFRAEVDAAEVNFFCGHRCCSRERIDVEFRLYSGPAFYWTIDFEKFKSYRSSVGEEAGEICVCIWNVVYLNSFEVWQPKFRSNAVSHQRFLNCVFETDFKVEAGDVIDLLKSYILFDVQLNVITAV